MTRSVKPALEKWLTGSGAAMAFAEGGRHALVAWLSARKTEPTFFDELEPVVELAARLDASAHTQALGAELLELVAESQRRPRVKARTATAKPPTFSDVSAPGFNARYGGEQPNGQTPERRGSLGWNEDESLAGRSSGRRRP